MKLSWRGVALAVVLAVVALPVACSLSDRPGAVGWRLVLEVSAEGSTPSLAELMEKARWTIENRLRCYGLKGPKLEIEADNRIVAHVYGADNQALVKDLILAGGRFEFHLVDEEHEVAPALAQGPPPGLYLAYGEKADPATGRVTRVPFLLEEKPLMTGVYINRAEAVVDKDLDQPYVLIEFDAEGGELFEKITGYNLGRRLAMVVDGRVLSAPVIQEKIGGGTARLIGGFNLDEAKVLAAVLQTGPLPAPVRVLEEKLVGGPESNE
ncbi:MAG: hypothetical protein AB1896_14120 [Thermodesulfobacteriota bacterium]